MANWTKVSDELPPEGVRLLVVGISGDVHIATAYPPTSDEYGEWRNDSGYPVDWATFTKWQHLPSGGA